MFGWFGKKANPAVFKPKERKIYGFWDGQRDRLVDPLPLYKAVMSKGPSLSIDMKVAGSASKDNIKAHDAFVEQLREIFGVGKFEDGGLTETEVEELFYHFWDYVSVQLKNGCSPTTTTATEASPNTGSTSGESQPTPNGSDSTSTASEGDTSKPSA